MTIAGPVAGVACLLLAAGCVLLPTRPTPDQVRGQLLQNESQVRTLRASARVEAAGPDGSGTAPQAIAVALPDRARLETLTPMGTTALVMVIRGEELRVHSPLRKEYGMGRATAETLGRLIHVAVPPQFLLRILAGLPPLPLRPEDPRTQLTPEGAALRIESVDGLWWQRLWTGEGDPAIVRGELGRAAGGLLRFGFADRRPDGDGTFPFAVWAEDANTGARLTLTYERVRLNAPVEDSLFDLPLPADGSRIFRLDEGVPPDGSRPQTPGRP